MKDIKASNYFEGDDLVADPYPYYQALRQECPIAREPRHGVMMVTGYEEAVEVLHNSEVFSSRTCLTGPFSGLPEPAEGEDIAEFIARHADLLPMNDQLPTLDPPTHTDHRALLMRLITPKRLKENEAAMWDLADTVLDQYLPPGEGDFIGGFAAPFTLLVIADLLGMPEEDRDDFAKTLRRPRAGMLGGTEHGLSHSPLEFLYERFSHYVTARRREPRDDVLTGLATATFPDGSTPEVGDVARVATNLFSAGQETTVRLLGASLQMIAEDAELQALLRAERHRIPNFIEETLRTESPIKGDFRLALTPATVGGVDIPAGTTLMVLNGAANRDPRRFDEPETFDATRSNARQHIAFGRGIHTCPGAPLARAEGRAAIERLLDRTTDIRISERGHGPAGARRYDYMPTFILRGVTKLSLEFTPGGDDSTR